MPGGRDAQVCTNLLQQYQKLGTIQPVTTMRKLVTILQPACCCNNTWVSAIFPLIQTHIPHQHIYCAAITVCLLFSCQKHSFSETMMKRSDNSEERTFFFATGRVIRIPDPMGWGWKLDSRKDYVTCTSCLCSCQRGPGLASVSGIQFQQ